MQKIHPALAALLSGVLIAISFPNLGGLTALSFVAFVPLLLLSEQYMLEGKGSWKYLLWCYLSFITWNFIDTYWLFFVEGDFWTRFFSAFMPSFINAFLMALPFMLYYKTRKRAGEVLGLIGLIGFWLAYEYIHLNWSMSWPWLVIGNLFAGKTDWIQWYEYTGHLGGSFWVLLANILFYLAVKRAATGSGWKSFISPALFILLPVSFSYFLLSQTTEKGQIAEVVAVQPNIDAYEEKFSLPFDKQLFQMLKQADSARTEKTSLLIFPETALQEGTSLYFDAEGNIQLSGLWENQLEKSQSLPILVSYLQDKPNLNILTGMSSCTLYQEGYSPTVTSRPLGALNRYYDSFNTALYINPKERGIYHKSKLVPAVEILPFATIVKPLLGDAILSFGGASGGLGTQEERSVFKVAGSPVKAAPIICYESIYGSYIGDYVNNGANLLCIMTNDGWWSTTAGHKHHLAFAKLRAIEHRRDIIRSANTGISAHIDQKGEILQQRDYNTAGAIRAEVHLNEETTFYTRNGDYLAVFSICIAAIIYLFGLYKRFVLKA